MTDEEYAESVREEMAQWRAFPQDAYLLEFLDDPEASPHRMCGSPEIAGSECVACEKPLIRLLSLKTAELPFSLGDGAPPWVHLFYCWTCAIPMVKLAYRLELDGSITLIAWGEDDEPAFGAEGPYEGYTGVFAERVVGLRPIPDEEIARATQLRLRWEEDEAKPYLTGSAHWIGGWPAIGNAQLPIVCPSCQQGTAFFATVADNPAGQAWEPGPDKSFTGNCGVQMVFHYCADCRVIVAYHSCD